MRLGIREHEFPALPQQDFQEYPETHFDISACVQDAVFRTCGLAESRKDGTGYGPPVRQSQFPPVDHCNVQISLLMRNQRPNGCGNSGKSAMEIGNDNVWQLIWHLFQVRTSGRS